MINEKTAWLIALDDTDGPELDGTGRVARIIAGHLSYRFPIWGVTSHQFLLGPEISYTSCNRAKVIHLLSAPTDPADLANEVARWVQELAWSASHPGLCLAAPRQLSGQELGRAAQQRIVAKAEVAAAAGAAGVILHHPYPSDAGLIGAFAAACLAAEGNDGHFVSTGKLRTLSGSFTPEVLLAAGVDEIRSIDGKIITQGIIAAERFRPALWEGKCLLFCTPNGTDTWRPIIGAPRDQTNEAMPQAPESGNDRL